MKTIQIIPMFGLGGAEIMCENLTYELKKLGHDVTVISMYDYDSAITERMKKENIDIRYLHKKSGLDLSMIGKMKKIFKEIHPDAIHTHLYCAQYAIPAAILTGVKKRVHTIHNVAQKENIKSARKLNKFFFKHCKVTPVALSELIRDTVVNEYKIEKEKVPVILNGINLSKCKPKRNYAINGNFKILHIGRFSEQKNHKGLLEAYKLFHNKYPDSELWLIGDGDKKAESETFVIDNGLNENIKFLGLQENVYNYLHDADMFILPSNYEGIPMALIEAMGTGLPIVASEVGGIPDMITDGENGLLCEPTAHSIAEKIEILIEDDALRKSCAEKAILSAQRFSAKTMAEKYVKIYEGK